MKHFLSSAALVLAVWALSSAAAQAQAPSTGGPTPTPAATAVPLDGGASLLLAGGIGYAVRKLRQRRQR